MASGDTKLSICSDSLIMLGASPLSSFSEGTDAAQICDRLYDDITDFALGLYPWSFSFKKVQLAREVDTPATEWKYQYVLPADLIGTGARALFTTSTPGARPVNEGWEIVGGSDYAEFFCAAFKILACLALRGNGDGSNHQGAIFPASRCRISRRKYARWNDSPGYANRGLKPTEPSHRGFRLNRCSRLK